MNLEQELQKAHLLCMREEFDKAESLLISMRRRYPGNAEVNYLLGRIQSTKSVEKEGEEKSRRIRYSCGLNTTWRRLSWGLAGICITAYGAWAEWDSLRLGFQNGFGYVITTIVHDKRGSHPYTRPVWWDVLMYGALLAAGIAMLIVLRLASKGIAQWEELDGPMNDNRSSGWW